MILFLSWILEINFGAYIQIQLEINLNRDIEILHFPRYYFNKSFDLIFSIAQDDAAVQAGKKLFNANCAACHKLNKRAVGPALKGVSAKYDKEWLYSWIKNSTAMVKSGDAQAVAIYEEYNGSVMTSFPQLSNTDIDNIIAYTDYTPPVQ